MSRKPAIIFQDDEHLDKKNLMSQAKFFVQLDDADLTCGYSVERPTNESEENKDWVVLLKKN